MKKLLVVFSAILLVVAFAVPALASEVTWSGEFTFGGITSFQAGETNNGYDYLYTDAEWAVDDYTTVLFEFGGVAGGNWTVDAAYLKTDLGAALGTGFGLTVKGGYTSLYSSKFEVSGNAYERTPIRSNIAGSGFYATFDFDMATLDVGFNMEPKPGAAPVADYGVLLTLPEVGPAVVEAFYMINDNEDFKGAFGADAKVTDLGPASVAVGFKYDTAAETWAYGVGVSAAVSMATVGASLNGNDVDTLNQVGIDLNVAPADEYGLDVGIGLSMADGADTFQGADISGYYKAGASKWVVGYLITKQGYTYAAPATSAAEPAGGGGLYIKCDVDF